MVVCYSSSYTDAVLVVQKELKTTTSAAWWPLVALLGKPGGMIAWEEGTSHSPPGTNALFGVTCARFQGQSALGSVHAPVG